MLTKGLTPEQITTALRNYADDPWRKEGGPRLSKNIRSFFTETVIREWQTPVQLPDRHPLAKLSIEPTAQRPALERFPRRHKEQHEDV